MALPKRGSRTRKNKNKRKKYQERVMPIMKARGPRGGKGFKYGKHGHVYPTKAGAIKQMVAIKISQGKIKPKKKQ